MKPGLERVSAIREEAASIREEASSIREEAAAIRESAKEQLASKRRELRGKYGQLELPDLAKRIEALRERRRQLSRRLTFYHRSLLKGNPKCHLQTVQRSL